LATADRCSNVVFAVEFLVFGHIKTAPVTLGPTVHDAWWLLGAILAPALIAPVIEELFFRWLFQRSIPARLPFAILASANVFSLIHLLGSYSLCAAVTTSIAGITFGILAGRSGRLGSVIVAHVVFNASLVVVLLFG
jgi:membrane protease YdiL (CAAX protease family)